MRRVCFACALLVSAAALAYVLPAGSILRRLAAARDELQLVQLAVKGSITFHGDAAKEAAGALGVPADRPELSADSRILLKFPGRCRFEVTAVESGKSAASIEANGKDRAEGSEIGVLRAAVDQFCAVLALRSGSDGEGRALIERHLSKAGVDFKTTSLGRFGGQVAYVLGAKGDGQPQFWVYKDRFLPARMRFAGADGAQYDLRFVDFSSPATGEWFPRILEVHRNGSLAARFTATQSDARTKLDDKLF